MEFTFLLFFRTVEEQSIYMYYALYIHVLTPLCSSELQSVHLTLLKFIVAFTFLLVGRLGLPNFFNLANLIKLSSAAKIG